MPDRMLLTLAILLAVSLAGGQVFGGTVTNLPVGSPTPPFDLLTAEGEQVTLRNEHGEPIVILFADLEQTNSRLAIADLHEVIARENLERRVKVFVIVAERSDSRGPEVPFPVLINHDRSVFAEYGVISALPCAVFLDANGLLHWAIAGYVTGFEDTAEDELAFLAGLLSEGELMARREGPEAVNVAETQLLRRVNLADQLRRRGLEEQAQDEYQAILEEAPANTASHLGLALIALHGNELPIAEHHARAALESSPGLPLALKTLANTLLLQGDLDGAEAAVEEFVGIAGEDVETHYMVGRIEEERGREERAMRHYRRACEGLLRDRPWGIFAGQE